nr:hypothetical protein BaRGS_027489 [Batillaria attramentaria]
MTLAEWGAENRDLDFLKQILEDPSLFKVVEVHENLEVKLPRARDHEAVETARDVLDLCGVQEGRITAAGELRAVMDTPHFKALLMAHDDVCNKRYEEQFETMMLAEPPPPVFNTAMEQGITVKLDEKDDLVIARILKDCLIDKQGLLHVDDIVREVNGIPVCTPEQLMDVIMDSDPTITFKVVPSYHTKPETKPVYMRARFNYDPMKDRLLPCKETGLPFQSGDVLEIVDSGDPNWWQGYYFEDRLTMEADIMNGKYLEYGDFNGNLYGTRLDTVKDVIASGKMCVLDVNPTSLKVLKTPQFLPYIVFIAAPSVEALKVMYEEGRRFARGNREEDFINTVKESQQIERVYASYFDEIIVNDSFEDTYRQLRKSLNELTAEQQWVPVNWVY